MSSYVGKQSRAAVAHAPEAAASPAPGKRTLVEAVYGVELSAPAPRSASGNTGSAPVQAIPAAARPTIQMLFGRHLPSAARDGAEPASAASTEPEPTDPASAHGADARSEGADGADDLAGAEGDHDQADHEGEQGDDDHEVDEADDPAPLAAVQQRPADGDASEPGAAAIHASAQRGIASPATPLPHGEAIQRAFGRHDISSIQAHVGADAAASAEEMGAAAYATGDHVVVGGTPDLFTMAHEAAHVVQQRAGVHCKGGVGEVGDRYEQHADEVAQLVVQGKSAEGMLDRYADTLRGAGDPAPAQGSAPSRSPIVQGDWRERLLRRRGPGIGSTGWGASGSTTRWRSTTLVGPAAYRGQALTSTAQRGVSRGFSGPGDRPTWRWPHASSASYVFVRPTDTGSAFRRPFAKKPPRAPTAGQGRGSTPVSNNPKRTKFSPEDVTRGAGQKVLLLGEGDFSFVASLAKILPEGGRGIVATSYDGCEEVNEKYKSASGNIRKAQDAGAKIVHGVDAQEIDPKLGGPPDQFQYIIFNFPFVPGDRGGAIERNKDMLAAFMKSASHALAPGGKIYVTSKPYWLSRFDLGISAKKVGLTEENPKVFDAEEFPGYEHRMSGVDASAKGTKAAVTLVFSKPLDGAA